MWMKGCCRKLLLQVLLFMSSDNSVWLNTVKVKICKEHGLLKTMLFICGIIGDNALRMIRRQV